MPCKGGIPPLTTKEITPFLKELSVGWTLIEKKQIEKSYTFPTYLAGIAFCDVMTAFIPVSKSLPIPTTGHFNGKSAMMTFSPL